MKVKGFKIFWQEEKVCHNFKGNFLLLLKKFKIITFEEMIEEWIQMHH
jgi:hypothetical protein